VKNDSWVNKGLDDRQGKRQDAFLFVKNVTFTSRQARGSVEEARDSAQESLESNSEIHCVTPFVGGPSFPARALSTKRNIIGNPN